MFWLVNVGFAAPGKKQWLPMRNSMLVSSNPIRECSPTFVFLSAFLDQCSHFTQSCGNALLVSLIIGNRIGRPITTYVRLAVFGEFHKIIKHTNEF